MSLSKRVQKVKPSPTLAMTARAAKLKAEGKDIIGLAAGEPDFDTPAHISDAGIEAIRKGITRYTAVDGTAELKDAIIAKFKRDNALTYERSQILVSSGAKQTCFNACAALLGSGRRMRDSGALLGVLSRHGAAGGRRAGQRVCRPLSRLQNHRRAAGGGDHAAHQAIHHQ